MNIIELGSVLEKKRQSKNLSIDDVSKAIKIPAKSLIALEHGDLEFIGYETYYKNFLKCYALHLGYSLDEYHELIKDVAEFSDQVAPPKSLEAQLAETQPEMTKPRGKKLAVQLLILAIIGGSAYFYLSQNGSVISGIAANEETKIESKEMLPAEKSAASAVSSSAVQADSSVQTGSEPNNEAEEDALSAAGVSKEETAVSETLAVSDKTKEESDESGISSADSAGAALVEQKMPEKEQQSAENDFDIQAFLKENPQAKVIDWTAVKEPAKGFQQAVMYASQDCWMQFAVDGKSSHFTLKRGEQRVFDFKESLYFKIANGAAITLFHDKKLVSIGDSSKLREVTLK